MVSMVYWANSKFTKKELLLAPIFLAEKFIFPLPLPPSSSPIFSPTSHSIQAPPSPSPHSHNHHHHRSPVPTITITHHRANPLCTQLLSTIIVLSHTFTLVYSSTIMELHFHMDIWAHGIAFLLD